MLSERFEGASRVDGRPGQIRPAQGLREASEERVHSQYVRQERSDAAMIILNGHLPFEHDESSTRGWVMIGRWIETGSFENGEVEVEVCRWKEAS